MLRAYGWALFRAVGRRWEAGEIKFESAMEDFSPRTPELQTAQNTLAQKVISPEMEACLRRLCSTHSLFPTLRLLIFPPDLVYLCNLAESMKFLRALDVLEGVWQVATVGMSGEGNPSKSLQDEFWEARALPNATPGFFSDLEIGGTEAILISGRLSECAAEVSEKAITCALWLVSFLVDLDMFFNQEKSRIKAGDIDKLLSS